MVLLLLGIIYLAFISLGLPDALLGAAWPSIYPEFGVPVSYAGGISMIISVGTVVSSLKSDRLTRRFGTGRVTAVSVFLTAAALFGFSFSRSYWMLCLWAVPYGLGAGSVDASLNNYVALHYASRHMSWLHCMWGIGASVGPYIMGLALSGGRGWNMGYRWIGILQVILTVVLFLSLPLWRQAAGAGEGREAERDGRMADGARAEDSSKAGAPLSLGQMIRIPGAKEVMTAFFCYCALEQTSGLWASSYLALYKGFSAEQAAGHPFGRIDGAYAAFWQCGGPGGAGAYGIWVRADLSLHYPFHAGAFWKRAVPGRDRRADGLCLCGKQSDAAAVWPDCQPYQRVPAAALSVGYFDRDDRDA